MKLDLKETFGNIDIYLFDQLLKGRYDGCKTILDAGCGTGRNLVYFLQNGFDVYGVDQDLFAVEECTRMAAAITGKVLKGNFQVAAVESLPFADNSFDLIISSAVLHFAQSVKHFEEMLWSMWRTLKPGGFLFARLASDIGIENLVTPVHDQRYLLPDGSTRFLVNLEMLLNYTSLLDAQLCEPIKTTNVQNLRCMTTWCIQKS